MALTHQERGVKNDANGKKKMHLLSFVQHGVINHAQLMWAHPRDKIGYDYARPPFWQEMGAFWNAASLMRSSLPMSWHLTTCTKIATKTPFVTQSNARSMTRSHWFQLSDARRKNRHRHNDLDHV
jgi:hypothetical protein